MAGRRQRILRKLLDQLTEAVEAMSAERPEKPPAQERVVTHRSPRFTRLVMAAALAVVFAQPATAQNDESNRVEFELVP